MEQTALSACGPLQSSNFHSAAVLQARLLADSKQPFILHQGRSIHSPLQLAVQCSACTGDCRNAGSESRAFSLAAPTLALRALPSLIGRNRSGALSNRLVPPGQVETTPHLMMPFHMQSLIHIKYCMLCSCQFSDRDILPAASIHMRTIMCCIIRLSYHDDPHAASPCSELPAPLSTIGPLDRGSLQGTRRDVPQQSSNPQLLSPDFIIPALHSTTSCCPVLVFQNNSPPSVLMSAGTIAFVTHHKTRLLLMSESPGSASMPPFPAVTSCSQSMCRQATSTALSPCSAGSSRLEVERLVILVAVLLAVAAANDHMLLSASRSLVHASSFDPAYLTARSPPFHLDRQC